MVVPRRPSLEQQKPYAYLDALLSAPNCVLAISLSEKGAIVQIDRRQAPEYVCECRGPNAQVDYGISSEAMPKLVRFPERKLLVISL